MNGGAEVYPSLTERATKGFCNFMDLFILGNDITNEMKDGGVGPY